MNTYKQINIIIGLLFVGLVGTFLYYMFDSGYSLFGLDFGNRQAVAAERQVKDNTERGGALYARYCRACHGLTGQGSLERTGLPGAVLNDPNNRPPDLIVSKIEARQLRLSDTIHCGRVGTRMPPWAIAEGGALNDFQILQLVTLITSSFSEDGWAAVIADGNKTDVFNPVKTLAQDVGENDTTIVVNDAATMVKDDVIRIGLDDVEEPYELIKISAVDLATNTLTVDRGPNVPWDVNAPDLGNIGSDAIEHKAGDLLYVGPQAPGTTITGGGEADAPCGQAKAVSAAPAETLALEDGAKITMIDNFFVVKDKQNPNFTLAADTPITAALKNTGGALHNFRIDGADGEYDTDDDIVSDPELLQPTNTGTIEINLAAGTYNYKCEIHPDAMKGTITVS